MVVQEGQHMYPYQQDGVTTNTDIRDLHITHNNKLENPANLWPCTPSDHGPLHFAHRVFP
uniref:Uncharacterized protein n=1 Tax=Timema poppense TaxID=170557 RepID=A0A7R9CH29_TIMPO|nr:unnamed protein product [Timema poppensis]